MGRNGKRGVFNPNPYGVPVIGAKEPGELARLRKIFLEKLRDTKPEITWDIKVRGKRLQGGRRVFNIFLLANRDFGGGLRFHMAYGLTPQPENKFNPEGTAKAICEAAEIAWVDYEKFLNKYNLKGGLGV